MANLLDGRDWDYVIGSVHFLRDSAVDMEGDFDVWRSNDPDQVWERYFDWLGEAARTGLFDILAHPDLVKVWGAERPRPAGDLRRFYDLAMDGIAESDVAIEVSTAGLRKPVGEIYPAPAFLEMCLEAGRPVALSSDAHVPTSSAYDYERARRLLGSRRRRARSPSSSAGERAARSRSDERRRAGHRLRLPPPRGGAAADPRRRRDRGRRAAGSTATPTPTS